MFIQGVTDAENSITADLGFIYSSSVWLLLKCKSLGRIGAQAFSVTCT